MALFITKQKIPQIAQVGTLSGKVASPFTNLKLHCTTIEHISVRTGGPTRESSVHSHSQHTTQHFTDKNMNPAGHLRITWFVMNCNTMNTDNCNNQSV